VKNESGFQPCDGFVGGLTQGGARASLALGWYETGRWPSGFSSAVPQSSRFWRERGWVGVGVDPSPVLATDSQVERVLADVTSGGYLIEARLVN